MTATSTSDLVFRSRRSPVYGVRGMVASSQPLATQAGLSILMAGGNAADAAVATAAALNVTEPCSTGIGGDCFALFFDAAGGEITALNASGRAPMSLSIELLRSQGLIHNGYLPGRHAHNVTVPGACSGWAAMLSRHGTMTFRDVLTPAIRLADDGFPVSPISAAGWASGAAGELRSHPNGREMLVDGRAPRAGQRFRNPGLARTFRAVAEGGADAFYRGEIARRIAEVVQESGGVLDESDLESHYATWDTPICTSYRDVSVWECPPNGQGLTALLALNILEGLPSAGPLTPQRLHAQIESIRLAFADTTWYVADPAVTPVPTEALLSKDYAAGRRRMIQPDRAMPEPPHGSPGVGSDTVYFCAVDAHGNACSFINSNYNGFGTGLVPRGCGFTLQNRGHNFTLDPEHPNALAPGKRPYHTIIPGLMTRADGSLLGPFGVMGGFMQPQGHLQVVVDLVDDGVDPQAALDGPRFCVGDGAVYLEEGLPARELAELGHPVRVVDGYARSIFGRGQIILIDGDGVLCAGSDPRADGCALGF
jgi:gamma-glutamyltranspeptidase/glutathione hydrolase